MGILIGQLTTVTGISDLNNAWYDTVLYGTVHDNTNYQPPYEDSREATALLVKLTNNFFMHLMDDTYS